MKKTVIPVPFLVIPVKLLAPSGSIGERRLDSGFRRSDGFVAFFEFVKCISHNQATPSQSAPRERKMLFTIYCSLSFYYSLPLLPLSMYYVRCTPFLPSAFSLPYLQPAATNLPHSTTHPLTHSTTRPLPFSLPFAYFLLFFTIHYRLFTIHCLFTRNSQQAVRSHQAELSYPPH